MLLSALWGGSFLFLRVIAPVLGPVLLIELRVLLAFVVLLPVLLLQRRWHEWRRHWRMISLVALGNMCAPFVLIAWATLDISAGLASILNATVPFFAALTALLFWRQRPGTAAIIGMLVGFTGVVVLVLGNGRSAALAPHLAPMLAGLLAAALYGFSANVISRQLQGVSGLTITTGSLFVSALVLAPLALLFPAPGDPTRVTWLSLLGLSLFCTAVAYLLFYRLINRIGAHRTVTVTFLVPVFSLVWGWMFLAETITTVMLGGCLLVLGGVATTTLAPRWWRQRDTTVA